MIPPRDFRRSGLYRHLTSYRLQYRAGVIGFHNTPTGEVIVKGYTRNIDEKNPADGAPRTPVTGNDFDPGTPTASPDHRWPEVGNYVYTPKEED